MKSIEYENIDIKTCDKASLIDLESIYIDKNKSVTDKFVDFINQVNNPFAFKVGDIAVKTNFGGEIPFDKVLKNLLNMG